MKFLLPSTPNTACGHGPGNPLLGLVLSPGLQKARFSGCLRLQRFPVFPLRSEMDFDASFILMYFTPSRVLLLFRPSRLLTVDNPLGDTPVPDVLARSFGALCLDCGAMISSSDPIRAPHRAPSLLRAQDAP